MPTQKIADLPEKRGCTSKDHTPPTHQYFEPGIYEHTCSVCGNITRFVVSEKSFMYEDESPTYISGTEDGI